MRFLNLTVPLLALCYALPAHGVPLASAATIDVGISSGINNWVVRHQVEDLGLIVDIHAQGKELVRPIGTTAGDLVARVHAEATAERSISRAKVSMPAGGQAPGSLRVEAKSFTTYSFEINPLQQNPPPVGMFDVLIEFPVNMTVAGNRQARVAPVEIQNTIFRVWGTTRFSVFNGPPPSFDLGGLMEEDFDEAVDLFLSDDFQKVLPAEKFVSLDAFSFLGGETFVLQDGVSTFRSATATPTRRLDLQFNTPYWIVLETTASVSAGGNTVAPLDSVEFTSFLDPTISIDPASGLAGQVEIVENFFAGDPIHVQVPEPALLPLLGFLFAATRLGHSLVRRGSGDW